MRIPIGWYGSRGRLAGPLRKSVSRVSNCGLTTPAPRIAPEGLGEHRLTHGLVDRLDDLGRGARNGPGRVGGEVDLD
jgi:hypothetical protein